MKRTLKLVGSSLPQSCGPWHSPMPTVPPDNPIKASSFKDNQTAAALTKVQRSLISIGLGFGEPHAFSFNAHAGCRGSPTPRLPFPFLPPYGQGQQGETCSIEIPTDRE
ncbi:hypothetical protein X797_008021 [Metarhizium robertsii]|uniref:Uncharacterized protein n=1 Tax=Metarhizium robertsii TaxID=568076 RepID=A0A014QWU6_9HYPO|nr:hypothetical protein X797_008021 [Metarhizium robertsii]